MELVIVTETPREAAPTKDTGSPPKRKNLRAIIDKLRGEGNS